MAKTKSDKSAETKTRRRRPALSPEAREKQLVSLAVDLAEEQLMNGTASSQIISHFLKVGSERERLERERLEEENKLLKAKTESIQSSARSEEMYKKAIQAFRNYSGHGDPEDYENIF